MGLSETVVLRVIGGWHIRCGYWGVLMDITSRTCDGSIGGCLTGGICCTYEQLVMLHAGIGARSVGSGAISTLLGSTVRVRSVGSIIALIEAGVSPQIVRLIQSLRVLILARGRNTSMSIGHFKSSSQDAPARKVYRDARAEVGIWMEGRRSGFGANQRSYRPRHPKCFGKECRLVY